MADRSKLPKMTRRTTPVALPGKKRKTRPGAVDDNAMKRVRNRKKQLEEAYGK